MRNTSFTYTPAIVTPAATAMMPIRRLVVLVLTHTVCSLSTQQVKLLSSSTIHGSCESLGRSACLYVSCAHLPA